MPDAITPVPMRFWVMYNAGEQVIGATLLPFGHPDHAKYVLKVAAMVPDYNRGEWAIYVPNEDLQRAAALVAMDYYGSVMGMMAQAEAAAQSPLIKPGPRRM